MERFTATKGTIQTQISHHKYQELEVQEQWKSKANILYKKREQSQKHKSPWSMQKSKWGFTDAPVYTEGAVCNHKRFSTQWVV